MAFKIIHTQQYYYKLYEFINNHIAGFNLAGTIIDAKTNTKKEILSDAWVFKYPSIPAKLASLADSYNIVIFTEISLSNSDELNLLIAKLDKIVSTILPDHRNNISYCISLSASSRFSKPLNALYTLSCRMGAVISPLVTGHDSAEFSSTMVPRAAETLSCRMGAVISPLVTGYDSENECSPMGPRAAETLITSQLDVLDVLDTSDDVSFYCGNNAGRSVNWKYKQIGSEHIYINKLADKSKTDLYFAFNCKIQFILPEILFCNLDINSINRNLFELIPRPYLNFDESIDAAHGIEYIVDTINQYIEMIKNPIMILLIGLPASGKTTLTKYIISGTSGTIHLDQSNNKVIQDISKDKISNKRLYNLKLDTLLEMGSNILVDNTNTKQADRLFHISRARKYGYKIIGITIDTNAELIDHLNMFRVNTGEKSKIPKVVYNTMLKHLKSEGINSTEFDLMLNYINQINPKCANYNEIYSLYC